MLLIQIRGLNIPKNTISKNAKVINPKSNCRMMTYSFHSETTVSRLINLIQQKFILILFRINSFNCNLQCKIFLIK